VDQVKKELARYKKPLAGAQPYYVATNTGGAAGANIRRRAAAVHQRYGDRGRGDDDVSSERSAGSLLKDYLTEESLAREIGVTIRTLRRWRKERQGPPITHVGRKVVYSIEGLRRWLAANEQQMPRARSRSPEAPSSALGCERERCVR
jgi:hypothetical protein